MAASSPATETHFAYRPWLLALVLVIVTFLAYFPALRGGFVFDDVLIIDSPLIHANNGLSRIWFKAEAQDYYPLTESLWWLEWRCWGDHATGYHAVNVLLHAVNAVLVWMVLRRLKIPGAWLAALVFAIHPVNVATVAWISEQKNTLSMLFYLVAILLYLRFDEKSRWGWYGLSLAAFVLALLSKTAVVMLPVVVLGLVWWLHRTVRVRDVLSSVPFFVLSLVMGLVNISFEYYRSMGGHPVRTVGFPFRLAAAGWVPWFYLYKALLPANLMVIYPQWEVDASRWVSYVPGLVLIGSLAWFWWKRQTWGRPWFFGLGYFVVTLFPVLGFFEQSFYRFSLVADHWQYYSIIGAIALAVAAGEWVCRRMGEPGRYARAVACVAVLLVLGAATWRRSGVYAGEETLWRDNVAKSPRAWQAHTSLGVALLQISKIHEAMQHFEQALRIKPDYAEAHYNLGVALAQLGRTQEAIAQYQQVLRIKPDFAMAHYNWGVALEQAGKIEEAIAHYEQALRINPDYAEAHNNLGEALARTGKIQEAIAHFEQALRIKPDDFVVHGNLGSALEQAGKIEEAIAHYEQALRINPDYAEAHNSLGAALGQTGKIEEAIAHFEQALRIKPDYDDAHNNLGVILKNQGKLPEAIAHYEQALRINPDNAEAHNNLGVALARLGRMQEAVGHWEQALRIKPDDAKTHYNLGAALAQLGRTPEAIAQYQQALEITPKNASAQSELGAVLIVTGNSQEAMRHLERALQITPDLVEAQNNLAWVLATLPPAEGGDPIRAIRLAQRACQLTANQSAVCADTLATAYAAAGRFDDAIATAQTAIDLARADGQAKLVKEIQDRLELYRRGRAYSPSTGVTSPSTR
jgi:tetratricopeptide (TPR) repeat protein